MKKVISIIITMMFIISPDLICSDKISLYGKITDEDNKPVVMAMIHLKGVTDDIVASDSSGYFIFENLKEEEYTIQVRSGGFEIFEKTLLTDDETNSYNIMLNKKSNFIQNVTIKVVELIIEVLK